MMPRNLTHGWRFLPAFLLLACFGRSPAATPIPEQLMPANTSEFVAVSDLVRLEKGWTQTQYARMVHDPAMRPFVEQLTPAVKGSNYLVSTIGISWDSVRASCSGELGWGMVPLEGKAVAHILTLDLAGRNQQAKVLQDEMIKALQQRQAKFDQRVLDGANVLVFTLPDGKQIIYGIKDTVLIITDHVPSFQGILARWHGQATNSLANHTPFRVIKERSQPQPGETSAARWYFDVMTRVETQLNFDPSLRKVKGDNFVEVLRKQGFDAVKGAGGSISFAHNGLDAIVRGSAYAPLPYRSSMRMAKFANSVPLSPEPWVPADVFSCVTLNIDLANAFDCFGPLFGRLADEPDTTFDEIMESFKPEKDPNGPGVNVRKDLFEQLQNRVTIINDAVQPVTAKSERFLIGIPVKDNASKAIIAEALHKFFARDRQFKRLVIQGDTYWEYQERRRPGKNQPRVSVPSTVFGVTNDNFYIATHVELLEKIIKHGNQAGMAQADDYRHALKKLAEAGAGPAFSRSFVRVSDSARNTYEMLRANKLAEAESIYAWVLNKVIKADATGTKLWFDGSKLPHYERVAPYLSHIAISATDHGDGWTATAIVLPK